jgi:hypothetical protein
MPVTKKTKRRAVSTKSEKSMIITKSKSSASETLFPKKVKKINSLLAKAKLLSA